MSLPPQSPGSPAASPTAQLIESEREHARLLQSVVETARAIFDSQAASIFLLDESAGRSALIFEAVSGKGEDHLVGRRFPADRGIAGWVLQSRQPIEVDDVAADRNFARDLAESTAYVPQALMAAPLLHGEEVLGVLEVLDRNRELRTPLVAMDLLALFAGQAAVALRLVQRSRRAQQLLAAGADGAAAPGLAAVLGLARVLDTAAEPRRAAGLRVIDGLEELLRPVD
ncbi:GAF domain-containing protein [Streptomyces sp. HC44]|uniref:GAF domain-containing protein n=1 Tax=Streptomyces scabichelini TaxID=2711217 RepID=A0A6G4V621_9ACTN|nr:GAF domain-containing protein [Streptomyces scabichelini]NGO09431.1 GAF domain-containing protein [Streptomyces scabichelini]